MRYACGKIPEDGDIVECVRESICGQSYPGVVGKQYVVGSIFSCGPSIDGSPPLMESRFKLISRKGHSKEMVRCNQVDRAGILTQGFFYLIIAADESLGVVKVNEHQNTWFSRNLFGPVLATDRCPTDPHPALLKPWVETEAERRLKLASDRVKELEQDVAKLKGDLFTKTWNYDNAMDANRCLRQQIATMKERFDRIRIEAQLG